MVTIYEFDPSFEYTVVLLGGFHLNGVVTDTCADGIVMDNLYHIPQTNILYFHPTAEKNETN